MRDKSRSIIRESVFTLREGAASDSNTRSSVFRRGSGSPRGNANGIHLTKSGFQAIAGFLGTVARDVVRPFSISDPGTESRRIRQGPFSREASKRDGRASLRRMQSAQKCSLERGKKGTEEEVGEREGRARILYRVARASCPTKPPPPPPQRALTRLSRPLRS